jgi:hypothetical protein
MTTLNSQKPTYGFGRLQLNSDGKPIAKHKKLVSLALYVAMIVELKDKNLDQFICFKFENRPRKNGEDQNLYGYVFIYRQTIFPEDGEFVGSLSEVKTRVKILAKKFGVKFAFVPDDVPFYNDEPFSQETGLKLIALDSVKDENGKIIMSSSDVTFWQKSRKDKILYSFLSRMRNLSGLSKLKKTILLCSGLSIIAITMILYIAKNYFFIDNVLPVNRIINTTNSFPAKVFIEKCLSNFDKLMVEQDNWQVQSFQCTKSGISIIYQSTGLVQRENLFKLTQESNIVFNQNSATLSKHLNFTNIMPEKSKESTVNILDKLNYVAQKLDFKVSITQKSFDIQTRFSPIFLYNNNVIQGLNLNEISMSVDNSGFFNWHIKGHLNEKK